MPPMPLAVGKQAPDFALADQENKMHRLADYQGRWIVLYWYPRDATPGCTTEACAMRDQFQALRKRQAVVLGASADSVASHKKFATTYRLPFPLLADVEHAVAKAYGVWGKKQFMGREFMGIRRRSFLIDPQGRIAKVYERVKPAAHAAEVLQDLTHLCARTRK